MDQVRPLQLRKAQREVAAATAKLDKLIRETADHFAKNNNVDGMKLVLLISTHHSYVQTMSTLLLTQAALQMQRTVKVEDRARAIGKKIR